MAKKYQRNHTTKLTLVVKEAAIYISYSFKQELSLFSIKGSGRMRTLNRIESNFDLMYKFYIQNEDNSRKELRIEFGSLTYFSH